MKLWKAIMQNNLFAQIQFTKNLTRDTTRHITILPDILGKNLYELAFGKKRVAPTLAQATDMFSMG